MNAVTELMDTGHYKIVSESPKCITVAPISNGSFVRSLGLATQAAEVAKKHGARLLGTSSLCWTRIAK